VCNEARSSWCRDATPVRVVLLVTGSVPASERRRVWQNSVGYAGDECSKELSDSDCGSDEHWWLFLYPESHRVVSFVFASPTPFASAEL
jgi:hypothetical protein